MPRFLIFFPIPSFMKPSAFLICYAFAHIEMYGLYGLPFSSKCFLFDTHSRCDRERLRYQNLIVLFSACITPALGSWNFNETTRMNSFAAALTIDFHLTRSVGREKKELEWFSAFQSGFQNIFHVKKVRESVLSCCCVSRVGIELWYGKTCRGWFLGSSCGICTKIFEP